MIVAYAGRRPSPADGDLPAHLIADVGVRIGRLLGALRPDRVVGAAAAGTDLLVLEAAGERGIPADVVLPTGRDRFRTSSVADAGERWTDRFDRLLARDGVRVLEHDIGLDGHERYVAGNRLILAHAASTPAWDGRRARGVRCRT